MACTGSCTAASLTPSYLPFSSTSPISLHSALISSETRRPRISSRLWTRACTICAVCPAQNKIPSGYENPPPPPRAVKSLLDARICNSFWRPISRHHEKRVAKYIPYCADLCDYASCLVAVRRTHMQHDYLSHFHLQPQLRACAEALGVICLCPKAAIEANISQVIAEQGRGEAMGIGRLSPLNNAPVPVQKLVVRPPLATGCVDSGCPSRKIHCKKLSTKWKRYYPDPGGGNSAQLGQPTQVSHTSHPRLPHASRRRHRTPKVA